MIKLAVGASALLTLATIASVFIAIWTSGDLQDRLSSTAFALFFLALASYGVVAIIETEGK